MRLLVSFFCLFTMLLGQSRGPAAKGQTMTTTKQVAIWDPFYNMPAFTMNIPADWEFEGAYIRGKDCGDEIGSVVYRANSPDGLTGVQLLPRANYFWAADRRTLQARGRMNCKIQAPLSGDEYLAKTAPAIRRGAQTAGSEASPNAAKWGEYLRQTDEMFVSSARNMGDPNPTRVKGEARRARVQYDYSGHPIEEWLTVNTQVMDVPNFGPMGTYPNGVMRLGVSHATHWMTEVRGSRAPAGRLDSMERELEAIHDSLKEIPEYHARYTAYIQQQGAQQIAEIQRMGAAALAQGTRAHEVLMANGRAFNQQMQQRADQRRQQFSQQMADKDRNAKAFQSKMDAREGRSQDYMDTILDQQLFYDPRTGTTTTQSNQYNHSFGDGNGTVIQTNSVTFDPNAALSGNWTELQPIHH